MTIIINTQKELEALINDNYDIIIINDNLEINCDIDIKANINASFNIKARNIKANDIKAKDIQARNIEANDIDAWNIMSWDIKAYNINASRINYYASCIAYESLKCKTIEGERKNALHACLDKPIEYIK
jgi:hypothetical protein